jgi:hypothetical protein
MAHSGYVIAIKKHLKNTVAIDGALKDCKPIAARQKKNKLTVK